MPPRQYHIHDAKTGAALAIRVTPRAAATRYLKFSMMGRLKSA